MKYIWINLHMIFVMAFLFIGVPSVFAEEKTGQAVFKDVIVEKNGTDIQIMEPSILFEGQNYLPLRAIANSLQKNIYLDENTSNLVIESSPQTVDQSIIPAASESQFRPSLKFIDQVSSSGVVVLEDNGDNIMFEKNGYSTFFPASTTKILTALIALEKGNLTDKVIVSENVDKLPADSQRVFVHPGDELTLKQLLYGMLLHSGNDSALAIAEHIAGSEEAFSKLMNEKAKEVGAVHSNFVNSHGYHHPDHYTTPYDLALILKAASDNPQFLNIINTPVYKAEYKNKNGKKVVKIWRTTNSFLHNSSLYVDGIIGGKTGYTNAAKRNLVTVAEHKGHRYFVVALKGNKIGRYMDTRKLLLQAYKTRENYDKSTIKDITVSYFEHSVEIGNQFISAPGQLFIYNGRTYASQSFLDQVLADVKQESLADNLVKIEIRPKFAFSEKVKTLSMAFETQTTKAQKQTNTLVHAATHLIGFANLKPFPAILGMNFLVLNRQYGFNQNLLYGRK